MNLNPPLAYKDVKIYKCTITVLMGGDGMWQDSSGDIGDMGSLLLHPLQKPNSSH